MVTKVQSVSYTHLDVYKRQVLIFVITLLNTMTFWFVENYNSQRSEIFQCKRRVIKEHILNSLIHSISCDKAIKAVLEKCRDWRYIHQKGYVLMDVDGTNYVDLSVPSTLILMHQMGHHIWNKVIIR